VLRPTFSPIRITNCRVTVDAPTLPVFLTGFITSESAFWAQLSAAATARALPVAVARWAAQKHLVPGLALGAAKRLHRGITLRDETRLACASWSRGASSSTDATVAGGPISRGLGRPQVVNGRAVERRCTRKSTGQSCTSKQVDREEVFATAGAVGPSPLGRPTSMVSAGHRLQVPRQPDSQGSEGQRGVSRRGRRKHRKITHIQVRMSQRL